MEKNDLQEYQLFIKSMGQLLSFSRLYNSEHPIFKERLVETMRQLKDLTSNSRSLVIASLEGLLLVNGQKVEAKNILMQRFIESLFNLQLGSLDIEPGASADEIVTLINALNQTTTSRGTEKIKDYFKSKNVTHIIPRLTAYKLVKEDEKVVRAKGSINISDLPPEIVEKFSQSLNRGEAAKFIRENDVNYRALTHDPVFLSGFVYDNSKKKNTIEELEKVLWVIGDYLISEISTAKEEELNRKLLDEFKDKLLSLWEDKKDKNWKGAIHKNITAISSALELKGLMVLYKKHKKEAEKVLSGINSILETLPPESQLYKKTKEELENNKKEL